MPRDFEEWADEELETNVRPRVSGAMIEWLRRYEEAEPAAKTARTSAEFNHRQGFLAGMVEVRRNLTRLLTEATNPEYSRDGLSL